VRRQLQTMGNAFMVFRYENPENRSWRFSFLQKGSSQKDSTTAKRYTYVFGREYNPRTANERFNKLSGKVDENGDSLVEDADLEEAFSVEALSDEFFAKYKCIYANFVQYITGKRVVKTSKGWAEKIMHQPEEILYDAFNHDDKRIRDYVKKLLGRIIFLYFVQKKGWFNNDLNYLQHLFESTKYQDDFLDRVLEPFFYTVLNTEPKNRESAFDTHNQNLKLSEVEWDKDLLKQWKDFPFLNGGLFERDENDIVRSKFPSQFFENINGYDENFVSKIPSKDTDYTWEKIPGIFDLFAQYNFTIDENDPEDAEVGIDPEMLGKIFENLLEDNKDKGAFYTPKEIVQYMCRESLVQYLKSHTEVQTHNAIENLIKKRRVDLAIQPKEIARQIYVLLENVKVCDPAIGSGVFPMGILNELYNARLLMYGFTKPKKDFVHFEVKKSIIENNIYGVDIERGAVDIARLRFWLALVIDAKEPLPLPNLDYKIMQGNSLLEQYEGIDLSNLTKLETYQGEGFQTTIFGNETDIKRQKLQYLIGEYYNCTNHTVKKEIKQKIEENIDNQLSINQLTNTLKEIDTEANPYFFLWHTWFSDVFNSVSDRNGFDIVIGNPPYVNISIMPQMHSVFREIYSEIHTGYNDLMYYFLYKGICLLSDEGILAFITSNYFLGNDYAKKLRSFLNDKLEIVINFHNASIFESASVHTAISFARKSCKTDAVKFYTYQKDKLYSVILNDDYEYCELNRNKLNDTWVIANDKKQSIIDKLKQNSIALGDLMIIEQGSKSGKNNVFTISKEYAEKQNFEKEVYHTNVKNSDIQQYVFTDRSNVVIYTDSQTNINKYPNVYKYLQSHQEELSERNEVGKGLYPWWRFDRPRNKAIFDSKEKIIVPYRAKNNRFAYDDKQCFNDGGDIRALIVKKDCKYSIKFLLGLLNSTLLDWYYGFIGKPKGNMREYFNAPLSEVPIHVATSTQQTPIIALVDKILAMKKANPQADTSELEREIDKLVYKLYNLTSDEISIIESENNAYVRSVVRRNF
jgi:hypothetical protein